MNKNINKLVVSSDPLSDEAIETLFSHDEEDSLVDYKLTFHNNEKEWLEITKDIVSFANTHGGYLVFGIKDGTYDKVGLDETAFNTINDPNNVIQKVNRYVEPSIDLIRCKTNEIGNNKYVVMFIPPSLDRVHIISKDGAFKFPSGKEKILIRKGTMYVRRSAGNHLVDSRDLDDIINRRINHFRSSLLDKIARVVEAPQTSDVFILSQDPSDPENKKFIIEDAPDAIKVKGMAFSIAPATEEEEISAWIAMTQRNQYSIPTAGVTWRWYMKRKSLDLTTLQKLNVAKYCLYTEVPAFYWLIDCNAEDIKTMLIESLLYRRDITVVGEIISTAAFLGKKFHGSFVKRNSSYAAKLSPSSQRIPGGGPRTLFGSAGIIIKKGVLHSKSKQDSELEKELDKIAGTSVKNTNNQPDLQLRWRAKSLDCYLYSRDDQYKIKKVIV